jgi:fatty-acyl-CoA synthase
VSAHDVELSPLRLIKLQARSRWAQSAITDTGGVHTYGQLWADAERVAGDLRAAGVDAGDRVVLALDAGAAYVSHVLGAWLVGATVVPLNTRLRPAEVGQFLDPVGASLLIVSEANGDVIGNRDGVRRTWRSDSFSLAATDRSSRSSDEVRGGLIIGTGGTTGVPKGALFDATSLWLWISSAMAHSMVLPTDVELFFSPFFHGTLVTGLLTTLCAGGSIIVPGRVDPDEAAATIATGAATRLLGTPTVLERILASLEQLDRSGSRLRLLQFGMGASRPDFAADVIAAVPGVTLMTGYGATEYGPVTRAYSWDFDEAGQPVGVGRPVPGADIRIAVDDTLVTESEIEGEIVVNAPWQMRGYCTSDTDLDANARLGAFLRSGDIGCFDRSGALKLTGRSKDTIRTGGETVYPTEVEHALHAHPDVAQCAVYGVRDELWGERVEAVVVAKRADADASDIINSLRGRLAGYKLPKHLRLVDELPLTTNLKVDRRRLSAEADARQSSQRKDDADAAR